MTWYRIVEQFTMKSQFSIGFPLILDIVCIPNIWAILYRVRISSCASTRFLWYRDDQNEIWHIDLDLMNDCDTTYMRSTSRDLSIRTLWLKVLSINWMNFKVFVVRKFVFEIFLFFDLIFPCRTGHLNHPVKRPIFQNTHSVYLL